jgi:hypothetical protein
VTEIRGGAVLPAKRTTELALRWALDAPPGRDIEGAILLVPELDDYLRPDEARRRFARVPTAEVIAVDRAKHLWVGEPYVRIVMNEIVRRVNPAALLPPDMTLPTTWADSLFRTDRVTAARSAIARLSRGGLAGAEHARARIPGWTGNPGSGVSW